MLSKDADDEAAYDVHRERADREAGRRAPLNEASDEVSESASDRPAGGYPDQHRMKLTVRIDLGPQMVFGSRRKSATS